MKDYGTAEKPIIVVWNGNEPLTMLETILFDELKELYGFRNIIQFINCDDAEKYFKRHKNLRNLNPAIVMVHSSQNEIASANFLAEFGSQLGPKLLVVVSAKGLLPQIDHGVDEMLILTQTPQKQLSSFLSNLFAEAVWDKLEPEMVIEKSISNGIS